MTRKLTPALLVTAVVLSLAAFAQNTSAAAGPAPTTPAATTPVTGAMTKVGIIDFQRAVAATNEGQRDFESLVKKFDPTQAKLKSQSDEVENLKKQLQTQSASLNDDARATMVKNLEIKQKALQRDLEDAQAEAQREQQELFNKIGSKVYKTLEKYAAANGFAVILNYMPGDPQSPLLWAVPQVDVTKEVVEAYNKESGVPPPVGGAKPAAAPRPTAPRATPPPSTGTPKK